MNRCTVAGDFLQHFLVANCRKYALEPISDEGSTVTPSGPSCLVALTSKEVWVGTSHVTYTMSM